MEPADGIRKLGFKRWYERELIEGHVYLVTALLAAITAAVCIEGVRFDQGMARASMLLVIIFVCGSLVLFSWRRFSAMLARAERYGDKSTCSACQTYARFDLLGRQGGRDDEPVLRVRCRACSSEWTLP